MTIVFVTFDLLRMLHLPVPDSALVLTHTFPDVHNLLKAVRSFRLDSYYKFAVLSYECRSASCHAILYLFKNYPHKSRADLKYITCAYRGKVVSKTHAGCGNCNVYECLHPQAQIKLVLLKDCAMCNLIK